MKLSLGFSPCPNDTFIFDAMIHGKIDTEGLTFEVLLEDVEALNRMALAGQLDITKLSYHAFAYARDRYTLLDAGSALGENCGPLLIARHNWPPDQVKDLKIAIPGRYTTAFFLFRLAFPEATQIQPMLFSEIENAVLDGVVDAGVIIHENRFTYAAKGLQKIIDLGEFWETSTRMPIPLGGIAVKKTLEPALQHKINRVMQRSVQYAFEHPEASHQFVCSHAQELSPEVQQQHIDLYVNHYTLDLKERGKAAIRYMYRLAAEKNIIPDSQGKLFLED
jgi:1,4-dihydroxy-6-naphthoate synthase